MKIWAPPSKKTVIELLTVNAFFLFQTWRMRCWPSSWRSFRLCESRWVLPSRDRSSTPSSACSQGNKDSSSWLWIELLYLSYVTTSVVASLHSREQLAASILQEGSAGCRVVQKFLKILQVVVQEPGQAFKPFLPSILSLCMEQVYPVVAEVSWCLSVVTLYSLWGLDFCSCIAYSAIWVQIKQGCNFPITQKHRKWFWSKSQKE